MAFLSFITSLQYSVPAPLLPVEMKRRGISQTFTGVAMACFSAGSLIAPLLVTSSVYKKCGRRGAAQYSLLLLSIALLLYSMAYFIPDQYSFLFGFVSALTRVLEGLGTGGSITAILSLISKTFPEERGLALSTRGFGGSLGNCFGVIFGTGLFRWLGYFGVFSLLSLITFLTLFFLLVFRENKN